MGLQAELSVAEIAKQLKISGKRIQAIAKEYKANN